MTVRDKIYKPVYADPEDYDRMQFGIPEFDAKAAIVESYLIRLDLQTKYEYEDWKAKVTKQFQDRQSSWLKKLWGKVYFNLIIPKVKEELTPKRLLWIFTKLDEIIPYMPIDTFNGVIRVIDKIAEYLYKKV